MNLNGPFEPQTSLMFVYAYEAMADKLKGPFNLTPFHPSLTAPAASHWAAFEFGWHFDNQLPFYFK